MQKKQGFPWSKVIRWTGTIVAFGLVIWLLSRQDWGELWTDIQKVGWWRFGAAFLLMMVSRIAITLRWHALLRGSGAQVPVKTSFRITFAGLFANNFLPSTIGGDVVRLAGAVPAGIDGALAAASLVMDRLVGMSGMAAFLPFGLPQLLAYRAENLSGKLRTSPLFAFAAAPESSRVGKLVNKVKSLVKRVWDSIIIWVRKPQTLILPFIFTLIHMLALFAQFGVILDGLNDHLSIWTIGGLWAIVYFVTLVPVSINGLGVQELTTTFAFAVLGGITEPHSLTLALLYRVLMMGASLPGALFIGGMLEKQDKAEQAAESDEGVAG